MSRTIYYVAKRGGNTIPLEARIKKVASDPELLAPLLQALVTTGLLSGRLHQRDLQGSVLGDDEYIKKTTV